jgi:formylglycine-generating enzyme required for sulfatase activity
VALDVVRMPDDLVPQFVAVPGGEFLMGATDGEEDERPARRVCVDAFQIAKHPITNAQYAQFVRAMDHPAPAVRELPRIVPTGAEATFLDLATPYTWRGGVPSHERERHPVVLVTYDDAESYCAWLSRRLGRAVRLPTEAEWERAARGGRDARRYPWGDDIDPSRANFLADPSLKRRRGTSPVGDYPANGFELCDMIGNVWEWVSDWYRPDAYRQDDVHNPRGPAAGTLRIVRGGAWVTHDVAQLRCAHRHKVPTDTYAYSIGFRVVSSDATGVSTDKDVPS